MSPSELTTTVGSSTDGVAERLDRLRRRLPEFATDRPDRFSELRGELEALRGETEAEGRQGLASALKRLVLVTEVWECLAAERPESAHTAASFCVRAIEHIALAANDEGNTHDIS